MSSVPASLSASSAAAAAAAAPEEEAPRPATEVEELPPIRATAAQRAALQALAASLQCPLCEGVARAPVTLGCGHFFCQECINKYSEDNWECPVCGMSVCMSRSDGRSFIQTDPQLETMVQSLADIQAALRMAPEAWWTFDTSATTAAAEDPAFADAHPSGPSEETGCRTR